MTLVENVTDVNDKIYEAAAPSRGSPARSSPSTATRWYLEDTDGLGLGRPDARAAGERDDPGDRRADRGAGRARARLRVAGRRLLPRRELPGLRRLSGAELEDMVSQEPSDLKEDQRDFALWKATKPHEDTSWDSPWGRGPPGLAHRVLRDGGEAPRPGVRDPRRRARPALPASRERARPVARAPGASSRSCGLTTGCSSWTQEKMSKSLGNIVSLRDVLDDVRAGGDPRLLPRRALAEPGRVLGRGDGGGAVAGGGLSALLPRSRPSAARGALVGGFGWPALDDDFNTPAALALLHEWRAAGSPRISLAALALFGLATRPSGRRARGDPALARRVAR